MWLNERRKLLIAGIDPGMTAAYAIVDTSGNFMFSRSAKELDVRQLLAEVHQLGKVIAVGTDKAKVPGLVQEFAVKIGAKVFHPAEDLKVLEKKSMTDGFPIEGAHQMDALASALYAFQQLRPLLAKVERFCGEENKHYLKNSIIEKVLKEGIAIRGAAKLLEMPAPQKRREEMKSEVHVMSERTMAKRGSQLKDLEQQMMILKRYNRLLKKELARMEQPRVIVKKDISREMQQKEQLIHHLRKSMNRKEVEKQNAMRKAQQLEQFLLKAKDHYVLKRLENLGMDELKRKRFLGIERDDILLVDNPNSMSMAAIGELRTKVSVIVHKEPVSDRVRAMLPFIFIDARELHLKEAENLVLAPRKQLDEKRSARNALQKVIEDYKRERSRLTSP